MDSRSPEARPTQAGASDTEERTFEDRMQELRDAHAEAVRNGDAEAVGKLAAKLQKLEPVAAARERARAEVARRDRARAEQAALERADAGLPPNSQADPQADPQAGQGPGAAAGGASGAGGTGAGPADGEPDHPVPATRPSTDPATTAQPARAAAPAAEAPPKAASMPPAALAEPRRRHWAVILGFVLLVIVPTAVASWYLWTRATDRYVSYAAFSVRTEEIGSAIELLGGVAALSGSSSSDPDILYAFIQSQEMVRRIDARLDLRALWARADPQVDPVFAYHPPGTIEDMTEYWGRMVNVYNDDAGLIDLEVQAFAPEDAHAIATAIYDESSEMINRLSAIAREDATGYARDELETAVEQLREARVAMTQFRNRTQIVDPSASLASQMGIISSLQQQLAETLIDLDILRQQGVGDTDPRIVQGQRRVEVIEERIDEERRKLGIGTAGGLPAEGNAFADIVGEYESLTVDLQFAQESYTAARATYDAAVAEARRQTRYLAAHVRPTLPEQSEKPERVTLAGLVLLFSFLFWSLVVLTGYALRDRR